MTPHPQRGNPGSDALLDIKRMARKTGRDVQELLTIYALESFLARLAESTYYEQFVLKGGVLLAAFDVRRPTRDVDFNARNIPHLASAAEHVVREVSQIDLMDGVVFDPGNFATSPIREGEEYEGIRVKLDALIDKSRTRIGIDINVGDPVWPPPQKISIPRLLGERYLPISLLGYPLTMVIAEKAVTFIQRGTANTRWRDYADLYQIIRRHEINGHECLASLREVSHFRRVALVPVRSLLADVAERGASQWALWRRRSDRHENLPEDIREVVESLAYFFDHLLETELPATWNPHTARWSRNSDVKE